MSMVFNSLEDGHTHKHTPTHTDVCTKTISRNQVHAGLPRLVYIFAVQGLLEQINNGPQFISEDFESFCH